MSEIVTRAGDPSMRVLIALGLPYPAPSASAGRIQKFARGLIEAGAEVLVLGQRPTIPDVPDRGTDAQGVAYDTVVVKEPRYFVEKFRQRSVVNQATFEMVERLLSQKHYDAVIAYGQSWHCFNQSSSMMRGLGSICHRHGAVCLMDCTEWHALSRIQVLNGVLLDQWTLLHRVVPRLDGIIGISKFWVDYAQRRHLPVIHIPALGEADVPAPPAPRRAGPFRLTYLGQMAKRDLPAAMIESVRLAVRKGHDVQLVVVGGVDKLAAGRQLIGQVAADGELKDRVIFTGFVSSEEVQKRLADADALVLLRNDRRMDKACFPTRLPEYLRTGRPVILAETGDMTSYFQHGKSAWLVPAGDCPAAVADAILRLQQDPALAERIGRSGQQAAVEHFSYKKHGQRLADFLLSRRKRRYSSGEKTC